MSLTIRTEIHIAAPPQAIWAILTDFGAYASWNPFIVEAEGEARVGSRLNLRIRPPGKAAMRFKPTVLEADPGRELRWLGRLMLPGIFDGEHRFGLRPAGAGTDLVHEERFAGLLLPVLRRTLEKDTAAGFEAMNWALRDRAEGVSAP